MKFLMLLNVGLIRKKLNVLVMLAGFPALVLLLYSCMEQRRNTIEDAKQDVLLLAHTMAEVQRGITISTRETLSTLAQIPAIQNIDVQAITELFRAVIQQNTKYLGITLTDF
jgi:hypothetical protein